MKKIMYPLLLLAVSLILPAESALVLTEEMAVSMALEQNTSLKSGRLDLESSEEAKKNSWNAFLPDFSVSGGIARSEEFLTENSYLDGDSWSVNGKIGASLTLNSAAALGVNTKKLSYETQSLYYESVEEQLMMNVRKQFYYLLANKENLELKKKNLDLAEKRYEQENTNFTNGLSSELTVLEARNSFESLRPSYTNTKTSYETQLMSFRNLLGLDLEQKIEVNGSLDVSILDLDVSSLIGTYLARRLDVQSSVKSLELQENILSVTKVATLTPSLMLSGDWSANAGDLGDIDWSDALTVSLMISLPLNGFIPGSVEKLNMNDADRDVEKARLSLQSTLDGAEQNIRTLVMQLEGSGENIKITELSVELAQKTFERTESAFKLGTREILDVEAAQNKLLSANQDLLQSRYNYLSGLLDLEYALNATTDEIIGGKS